MNARGPYRLIISGGGTGGHVFPAIAIANAFRDRHPDADILFVGAEGKMEMTRVPEAGYKIIGLWISGLTRRLSWSLLMFPFKLISSYLKARKIVKDFKPHVAIGTGGYASGPLMMAATRKGIPMILQEQNSYAGLTNKQLADKVQRICVAYPGMEKYFPREKVTMTGNPVRKDIINLETKRNAAINHFGFKSSGRTLLVLGGSGGARTINESVIAGLDKIIDANVQLIWQTGKVYYEGVKAQVADKDMRQVRLFDFLREMDLAYAATDVVVSRAGALSISELCLAKKPSLLVPSPNVAEDHQTKNAQTLVNENAAVLIRDADARERLVVEAMSLLFDEKRCKQLSENIGKLGKPRAAEDIVTEIEKLLV
ncbi:MAG TPA: undecaprenyldiphospho-muramoylpentapeptide beta-N-acetylglucosaminyltransferase [Cyclobacteriaceae bacterium]|nr:undecaprenyldiphospho-muramoylpentapeptide beta-N-acetylglucosaminyltransferase [Cyclobacteriaceae bacterium]